MKLKKVVTPVLLIGAGCAIVWVARQLNHLATIDIGEITYDEDPEDDETEEFFLDRLAEELKILNNTPAAEFLDVFKEKARQAYATVKPPVEKKPQPLDFTEFFDHLLLAQQVLDEGQTLRPEQIELLLKAEELARRTRDEATAPSVEEAMDNVVSFNSSGVVMETKPGDPDIITEDRVRIDEPKSERLPEPPPSPTAQDTWLGEKASDLDYTGRGV